MLELMLALVASVASVDAMANELSAAADMLAGHPMAETIREQARQHRIQVQKLRGDLAVVRAEYVERYGRN